MVEYFFGEDGGTVIPIFGIPLDEGPSIDIADIGFTVGPQKIEPAHLLLELLDYPIADKFLIRR